MTPICVPCQRFFRMKRSGYYFTEGMPKGGVRAEAGKAHAAEWKPYKIWSGDLWACPDCGATIVSGVGFQPVSEHYKENFDGLRRRLHADQFQVSDY